jgi:hypothetical protein
MQLRIIANPEDPDGVYVAKGKGNMNIGLLSQKIQVRVSQTAMEEFVNAFLEEMGVKDSLDQVLAAFEPPPRTWTSWEVSSRSRSAADRSLPGCRPGLGAGQNSRLMLQLSFVLEDCDPGLRPPESIFDCWLENEDVAWQDTSAGID